MKHYVYILNTRAKILHVGMCEDIIKALAFYNDMPIVSLDANFKLFKLLYLIEYTNLPEARKRFEELTKTAKNELVKLIKEVNPDLVELKPGINIEV